MQKLNSRKAALVKTKTISERQKPPFRASLLPCLMSSEDSEDDGTFSIRPLPWRSDKASVVYHTLDEKHDRRRSTKSKMMTFERKIGMPSDRKKPHAKSVPDWCLKK